MALGLSYKLKNESDTLPAITASFDMNAPTGETNTSEADITDGQYELPH